MFLTTAKKYGCELMECDLFLRFMAFWREKFYFAAITFKAEIRASIFTPTPLNMLENLTKRIYVTSNLHGYTVHQWYQTLYSPTNAHVEFIKGKALPLQAIGSPEGSRKLRLLDFLTTAQYGGRLSALRTGRLYPQGYSWYSFSLGVESTPGPWFSRKEICHWKIQWHHRELIPEPSD